MVENYELQLFSQYLPLVVDRDDDVDRGSVLATTLRGVVGDPLFVRVGALDERLRQNRQGVAFAGWDIKRSYSDEELARAQLFLLNVPMTHVSAEEYGTGYQESAACDCDGETLDAVEGVRFRVVRKTHSCGLSSKQVGPLKLPFKKLKSGEDVYRVWGGELVVSERFVALVYAGGFSGTVVFPVSDVAKNDLTSPLEFTSWPAGREILAIAATKNLSPTDWAFWQWLNNEASKPLLERLIAQMNSINGKRHPGTDSKGNFAQLVLRSKPLQVSGDSRFGATPFDAKAIGSHRCDAGAISGLRPISQVSIVRSSWDGSDLCRTGVYVGARQGLFRPYQLFIVSKRLLDALLQERINGLRFEVVEMV